MRKGVKKIAETAEAFPWPILVVGQYSVENISKMLIDVEYNHEKEKESSNRTAEDAHLMIIWRNNQNLSTVEILGGDIWWIRYRQWRNII